MGGGAPRYEPLRPAALAGLLRPQSASSGAAGPREGLGPGEGPAARASAAQAGAAPRRALTPLFAASLSGEARRSGAGRPSFVKQPLGALGDGPSSLGDLYNLGGSRVRFLETRG